MTPSANDAASAPGHNRPPLSKVDFISAIDLWTKGRRAAIELAANERRKPKRKPKIGDLLSAEEIGRLEAFDRLDAQRKALVLNTSEFYRSNPKADVALGVTVLTHVLSDNDNGINSLSESSMAAILHRSREAVSRAAQKEASNGRILKLGENGKSSRLAPVIPRVLLCHNHVTWLTEALKRTCDDVRTGDGATSDEVITPPCNDVRTGYDLTCDDVAAEPVTTSSHNFTNINSEEGDLQTPRARQGSCDQAFLQLTEDDEQLSFDVLNTFSRDPRHLATIGVPVMPRGSADTNIASRFSGWTQTYPPGIVLRCLRNVLGDMQMRAHDPDRVNKCQPTLSGFSGYLKACMESALAKAVIADGTARTVVATEQEVGRIRAETQHKIGEQQIAAHAGAIERNANACARRIEAGSAAPRLNGHAQPAGNSWTSINDQGKRRYNRGHKVIPLISLFGEHANKLIDELEPKGATFDDIDAAFDKENGKDGHRTQSRDEVLRSVGKTVMKTLNKRRDAALKDQFGEPEGLCGGYPHPLFRHEWICISREKVAEILALCPEVKPENGVWRGVYHGPALNSQREDVPWNEEHLLAEKFGEITSGRLEGLDYFTIEHDDYGSGMQIRVEAELLQAMLEEQAEAQATRERREQEAAQREADSIRKREQAEEKRRQWEAGRAERERLDRELREKRAAEEVARNAAFEAEALNLDWDGQRLTVTEEGMALLKGVSKAALDATLGELSKNIMNPVMRQIAEPGNPSAKDLVDIWRNIMRGAPYLMEAAT